MVRFYYCTRHDPSRPQLDSCVLGAPRKGISTVYVNKEVEKAGHTQKSSQMCDYRCIRAIEIVGAG
jgi:hypothetical protein